MNGSEAFYQELEREGRRLYLSQRGIKSLGITMDELISLIEEALCEKERGAVEIPPKPDIHPRRTPSSIRCPPSSPRWARRG